MISDESIQKYMNDYYFDTKMNELEQQILELLLRRQEEHPSEENDAEWLAYTDFIVERRKKAARIKWMKDILR